MPRGRPLSRREIVGAGAAVLAAILGAVITRWPACRTTPTPTDAYNCSEVQVETPVLGTKDMPTNVSGPLTVRWNPRVTLKVEFASAAHGTGFVIGTGTAQMRDDLDGLAEIKLRRTQGDSQLCNGWVDGPSGLRAEHLPT